MKNSRSGSTIMAAMGLAATLMLSVVGIMAMQKSIEEETRQNALRHARYLAEDILKTQVAIKVQQAALRTEVTDLINEFGDPNTGLRVPVPGTDCGNAEPCALVLLSADPSTPEGPSVPSMGPTVTEVTLRIGVSPAQSLKMKYKLEPMSVVVRIPTQQQIDLQTSQSTGTLKCDASAPVFKGIKRVGENLVANCESIAPSSRVLVNTERRGVLEVVCHVAQGRWMDSINENLIPQCLDFVAEERVPASLEICSDPNQYPESYHLDGRFNVADRTCVNRGSPYEFAPEAN